jgi:hypothetical protein
MTSSTIVSLVARHAMWVLIEDHETMRIKYDSDETIIEDIKEIVLKEDRYKYHSFFMNNYLSSGDRIPLDTTSESPVVFKLINNRRSEYCILL